MKCPSGINKPAFQDLDDWPDKEGCEEDRGESEDDARKGFRHGTECVRVDPFAARRKCLFRQGSLEIHA